MAATRLTSQDLKNGTIVDADIAAGAAIDVTKIAGGGAPTGAAGGDLGGTYPNPTVTHVTPAGMGTVGIGTLNTGKYLKYTGSQVVASDIPSTSPAGAGGQIQFNNGAGAFAAATGTYWDEAASALTIFGGASTGLFVYDGNGNSQVYCGISGGAGVVGIGDIDSAGNAVFLLGQDSVGYWQSGSDIYYLSASHGPCVVDRTTATRYRFFVDNGVIGIEAV